jgi:glycosyltransferase involved in cell wall biosynthesis
MDEEYSDRVICIVSPNKAAYSETFIQAHIDHLPTMVKTLYGYPLPVETSEGETLYSSGLSYRVLNILGVSYLGYSDGWYQRRKLKQYLLRNHVQAVLAEYGHTGVAMMEVCREAKIPLIVHFHGHDAYRKKFLDKEGQGYPELFRISAALIVVSQDMHRQLLNLGAPSEKIFINPYGVGVSQFNGADPANADPVFISVGRFVDKKAPHLTLMAFNKVLESNPGVRLVMLGDGPLLEACHQLAHSLAISSAVDFRGACTHDQVAEEMRSCRVFVQHSMKTSYGDSEGTPVAVLEASAAGLPVVATRHAGIKDVIRDGETGYLVEEGDIDGMAKAMKQLVNDPLLAARFGQLGRERVKKEYSMDKSIKGLWSIIEYALTIFEGILLETR